MCDPVSMGVVTSLMMGMSMAGTGLSMYSNYTQTKNANRQAEYSQQVADANAQAARTEGAIARTLAHKKAAAHRKQVSKFIGTQRTAMGASGLVVDEGTFLDVNLDTAELGKLDEMAILFEGELGAWQSELKASNYEAQGNLYGMGTSSPFLATIPPLLSGLSTGASFLNMGFNSGGGGGGGSKGSGSSGGGN